MAFPQFLGLYTQAASSQLSTGTILFIIDVSDGNKLKGTQLGEFLTYIES